MGAQDLVLDLQTKMPSVLLVVFLVVAVAQGDPPDLGPHLVEAVAQEDPPDLVPHLVLAVAQEGPQGDPQDLLLQLEKHQVLLVLATWYLQVEAMANNYIVGNVNKINFCILFLIIERYNKGQF